MEAMNNQIFYFAYGSNMSVERLATRVNTMEKVCIAILSGYSLKFHKVSKKDGSGKCDAAYTGNPSDKVYGVLCSVRIDELAALDRFEGRGYGYERKQVVLISESGETFNAESYIATNVNPNLRPYSWYKEHVLRGAQANGLPEEYVAMIEAVVTDEDPDKERHARELAIYS